MADPLDYFIPGIGAAASIVGGAISRGQAKRDLAQQRQWYIEDREYNSPKNQLRRVKEAGLPGAAYFGGGANSQSAPFTGQAYETDNGISQAGEHISRSFSTRLQRIQSEAAEQNLAILKNQRKISDLETGIQLKNEVDPDQTISTYDPDTATYNEEFTMVPHYMIAKNREEKIQAATLAGKEQDNLLKKDIFDYQKTLREKGEAAAEQQLIDATNRAAISGLELSMKKLNLEYEQNDHQFKMAVLKVRSKIFDAIKKGHFPNLREIFIMGLNALEKRM